MSEQKQVQLDFFKKLMVDFSYKTADGFWSVFHLLYSVKTSGLSVVYDPDATEQETTVDCGYFKIPVKTDIQYVVRNLVTIALTRIYENGFNLEDIRILDVHEEKK